MTIAELIELICQAFKSRADKDGVMHDDVTLLEMAQQLLLWTCQTDESPLTFKAALAAASKEMLAGESMKGAWEVLLLLYDLEQLLGEPLPHDGHRAAIKKIWENATNPDIIKVWPYFQFEFQREDASSLPFKQRRKFLVGSRSYGCPTVLNRAYLVEMLVYAGPSIDKPD